MRFLLLLLITLMTMTGMTQQGSGGGFETSVSGNVLDAEANQLMEYANIVLYRLPDTTMTTGTVTDVNGNFEITKIRPGNYFLTADFIGYKKVATESFYIGRNSPNIDLGTIELHQTTYQMDEVTVEGEKMLFEYKIDKKIINVDNDLVARSGTAVDALENSPSVEVDIEGNVTVRGSSNFTVLIDGRPTIMDANDALEQIPASTIENIELITNPSARYDPEGTGGIINVVLKKNSLTGWSGMTNLDFGSNMQYGIEATGSYRVDPVNFQLSVNYDERIMPGSRYSYTTTYFPTGSFTSETNGDMEFNFNSVSVRAMLDYNLTDADMLTIGSRIGTRDRLREADFFKTEWYDDPSASISYNNESDNSRGGTYYNAILGYERQFGGKDHKLSLEVDYGYSESREDNYNNQLNPAGAVIGGQRGVEEDPEHEVEVRVDYVWPISDDQELELGYESEFEKENGFSETYEYDPAVGDYIIDPVFSHESDFTNNYQAAYITYGDMFGDFGYKLGFRTEYTDREIYIIDTDQTYHIDRPDYFPSVHLSYSLSEMFQVMGSYSRRINRPRGWYLEPYETWMDANNVRRGNPGLEPEYINSFELGFLTHITNATLSLEGYMREVTNNIERIQTAYSDDVLLHTYANAGTNRAMGIETMINIKPFDWWNINASGSGYHFTQEGDVLGESFDIADFSWRGRFSNQFKLMTGLTAQVNLMYRGPHETAQGKHEGMVYSDAAVSYEFTDFLDATLRVSDLFGTAKREGTSQGSTFYSYNKFNRASQQVMLTLSMTFNNYRDRNGGGDGGGDMGIEESGF